MAKKKSRRQKTKAATTLSADERIQLHERDRNVVALETVVDNLQGIDEKVQHDSNMASEPDTVEATLSPEPKSEPKPIDNKDAKLAKQNTPDQEDIVMEHNSKNSGNNPDPAVHVYTYELDTAGASDARSPEPKSEPIVNKDLKLVEHHNSDPEDIVVNHDSNNNGNDPDSPTHVNICELDIAGATNTRSREAKSVPVDNKDLKLAEQNTPDPEDIVIEHNSNNSGSHPGTAVHLYSCELDTAGASDARSPEPKIEPIVNKDLKLAEQHNLDPEDNVANHGSTNRGNNPDSPAHVNTCNLDIAGATNSRSRGAKNEPLDNKKIKLVEQHNRDLEGIVVNHDSNNSGNNPNPSAHVYDGIKGIWAWSKEHVILVSSVLDITEGIANKVVRIVLHSNLQEMDENVVRPILSGLDEKVLNPVIHIIVSTGLGAGDFIAKTVVSPLVSLPAVVGLIKKK